MPGKGALMPFTSYLLLPAKSCLLLQVDVYVLCLLTAYTLIWVLVLLLPSYSLVGSTSSTNHYSAATGSLLFAQHYILCGALHFVYCHMLEMVGLQYR